MSLRSFFKRGVNRRPGLRSNDTVGAEAVQLLPRAHTSFRLRAEETVAWLGAYYALHQPNLCLILAVVAGA
jgi:hypothetical protein